MQHFPKEKVVLALVVSSLVLFVFMLLVTTKTITNVSGVEMEGVGVYWDSNCSNGVSSIDWGTLTPGLVKNIVVYIRNEDKEWIHLVMSTMNWNPSKASNYITLEWDYNGWKIDPDEVLQIKLILSVSRYIEGITNFSFDIVITGSQRLLGDVDGDGRVSTRDIVLLMINFDKSIEEFPQGDIDGDGKISIADVVIVQNNFGKTW